MSKERKCAACGEALKRRANEKPFRFRERKTCNGECQRIAQAETIKAKTRHRLEELPERKCRACFKVLKIGINEKLYVFRKRLICNRECQEKALRARALEGLPERGCRACSKTLKIHADESLSTFRKRKTCNRECQAAFASTIQRARGLRGLDELPERRCLACHEMLKVRSDELLNAFRKRVTCNNECAIRVRTQRFDVFGAALTVREIAKIVGVSSEQCVRRRLSMNKSPLWIARRNLMPRSSAEHRSRRRR